MINLNEIWIDIECPKCRYQDYIHLIDIKSEKIIFCHNCKTEIQLNDKQASVHSGIENINETIKQFEQTLKNIKK